MRTNQGSAVIYIVLLIFVMITSSAIVLSTILNRHIRVAENYLISEQSFSAANSAIELMLYKISKLSKLSCDDVKVNGSILYSSGAAVEYIGKGSGVLQQSNNVFALLEGSGLYKSIVRRVEYGGGAIGC